MCNDCNISVSIQHTKCPLCGGEVKGVGISTLFPKYDLSIKKSDRGILRLNIFLFIMITIGILSLTINFLTYNYYPVLWSLIVTGGLIYLTVSVADTFASRKHIGRKILTNYLALSLFLVIIDLVTGNNRWSTNYVIPLLGIVNTFLMTLLGIVKRSLWKEDSGYLLAMFLLNGVPLLLFLLNLSTVLWPSIASMVYSLVTTLGMIIFARRQFQSELRKRFHL